MLFAGGFVRFNLVLFLKRVIFLKVIRFYPL